jgi:hypothetical protein
MRFLLTLAACAVLTVSAFAQAPQELNGIDTIKIYTGETRLFTFNQPVVEIRSTGENVKISPESDRTFAFIGLTPGSSIVTALNADRQLIYRARLVVAGSVVRIYGTSTADEKKADYVGYTCTDLGCGRADPEIDRKSASVTVERSRPNLRGGLTTTTTTRD